MGRIRRAGAPVLLAAAMVASMIVVAGPAGATLQLLQPSPETPATFVGHGGYSADGLGQTEPGGTVQADVPSGSTVVQAYLYGTYNQNPSPDETARTITIDSTNVVTQLLANSEPGNSSLATTRADVTALVAAKVGSGGGITDFTVNSDPATLDGVALVVLYANETSPEVTVAVLDGGSVQTGDQVTVNFAAPIQPSAPGFSAVMSLGSGFSYQNGVEGHACGGTQFSTVTVNGEPLSSCAGNFDDGVGVNDALITVGGVGDSTDNPADGTSSTTGTDDELYDLAPFLSDGDTALVINTANPSNDDNLFLAVVSFTGEAAVTTEICDDGIDNDGDELIDVADPDCTLPSSFDLDLTPATATNPVNTEHTVTATLTDSETAVADASISFSVAGANPTSGSAVTDESGQASFAYTGTNPGDDTITACYEQGESPPCEAIATATKTWTAATSGLDVTSTSQPPTVTAGRNVVQTFTLSNPGGTAATGTTLGIDFPAGSVVQSNGPSQGTCTAGPAALDCAFGTVPAGGTATVQVVVTVPAGFPPGFFAPTATADSDQSAPESFGELAGSDVVAPGSGQAFGFVPPGGSITTGDASPQFPTAATFTLPNTGAGTVVSLTTEATTPTYCGGQPCRGRLLTLAPFSGGYTDPRRPPVLDISLDRSVVRRSGPAFRVWVQKEDTTVPPQLVPDCRSHHRHHHWWFHHWWKAKKVAEPSPCVSRRYFDRRGDAHVEILVLEGDPKFGRR